MARQIEAGPGLICLVGPDGCGKTFLLSFYETVAADRRLALRTPDAMLAADTEIDLVDGVSSNTVASLAVSLPPGVTRVLAMRPETLLSRPGRSLGARAVHMAPMSESDVRAMVNIRCRQMGAWPGIFTDDAMAGLVQSARGSPRQVDKLVREAIRHALNENHGAEGGPYPHSVADSRTSRGPVSAAFPSGRWLDALTTRTALTHPGAGRQGGEVAWHEDNCEEPEAETPALVDPAVAQQEMEMAVQSRPGRHSYSLGRVGVTVVLASAMASVPATWSARPPGPLAPLPQQVSANVSVTDVPRIGESPAIEPTPAPAVPGEVAALAPEAVPSAPVAAEEGPAPSPEAAPLALGEAALPALPAIEPPMPGNAAMAAAVQPMPARRPNPVEAVRLLALADTMLSAGQTQDAAAMLRAAAALGSKEAKSRLEVSPIPR